MLTIGIVMVEGIIVP